MSPDRRVASCRRTTGRREAVESRRLRSGRRPRGTVARRVKRSANDDLLRHRTPRRAVFVQRFFVPIQSGDQRVGQLDRVKDPGIHALPTGRAVHVRGIAG
jgi:hypothetical protein